MKRLINLKFKEDNYPNEAEQMRTSILISAGEDLDADALSNRICEIKEKAELDNNMDNGYFDMEDGWDGKLISITKKLSEELGTFNVIETEEVMQLVN